MLTEEQAFKNLISGGCNNLTVLLLFLDVKG